MGSLYQQKSRDGTPGRIWWVKWYQHGRPVRESTGTTDRKQAEKFLKTREGRVAAVLARLLHFDLRLAGGAVLLIGGLIYIPFCLFEIKMSPQLHKWVYGYHQHAFDQNEDERTHP